MADYAIHDTTLTGISNVIRKKDGTSALIDPADYADRINLMGMLEEKTVSGAIATFSDGADAVPLKKCEVTLPASLDGYSEVNGVRSGKNLLNVNAITNTTNPNNATIVNNGNGTITVTTTTQQNVKTAQKLKDICPNVKVGETYFLNATTTGNQKIIYLHQAAVSWTFGTAKAITSQMLESDVSLYASGTNSTATISDLSLTYGSTATAYEPYTAPTQYTASLGRTIYGGTADIVNGQGTDENNKFTVTSDMSNYIRYIGSGDTAYIQINKTPVSNGRWQDLVCSHFTPANIYAGGTQQGIGCYSSQFYIRDSRFTSKQDFIDFLTEQETLGTPLEICYKLATLSDFTFDPVPIDSKLGNNTIWSEQGDTEVTYRSQGTVYIYPNAEEASF